MNRAVSTGVLEGQLDVRFQRDPPLAKLIGLQTGGTAVMARGCAASRQDAAKTTERRRRRCGAQSDEVYRMPGGTDLHPNFSSLAFAGDNLREQLCGRRLLVFLLVSLFSRPVL